MYTEGSIRMVFGPRGDVPWFFYCACCPLRTTPVGRQHQGHLNPAHVLFDCNKHQLQACTMIPHSELLIEHVLADQRKVGMDLAKT